MLSYGRRSEGAGYRLRPGLKVKISNKVLQNGLLFHPVRPVACGHEVRGSGKHPRTHGPRARDMSYGRTAPSSLFTYQEVSIGMRSTTAPVCGASMM